MPPKKTPQKKCSGPLPDPEKYRVVKDLDWSQVAEQLMKRITLQEILRSNMPEDQPRLKELVPQLQENPLAPYPYGSSPGAVAQKYGTTAIIPLTWWDVTAMAGKTTLPENPGPSDWIREYDAEQFQAVPDRFRYVHLKIDLRLPDTLIEQDLKTMLKRLRAQYPVKTIKAQHVVESRADKESFRSRVLPKWLPFVDWGILKSAGIPVVAKGELAEMFYPDSADPVDSLDKLGKAHRDKLSRVYVSTLQQYSKAKHT